MLKQHLISHTWMTPFIALIASILFFFQYFTYRLDFETMRIEHTTTGSAHSFVRSSYIALGQSLGASYTSNGVILIWSMTPFEIIYELPFAHRGSIQLQWQAEQLLIHTDTQQYTFNLRQGLSKSKPRVLPLEPKYQLIEEKELKRLHLPKGVREYRQNKEGIFGLLSDGSLFKQSGLIRDLIPADASELDLTWSETGILLAEQSRAGDTHQSQFHWFPAQANSSHLTWTDKAWRTVYWQPRLKDANLLSKSKYNYTVSTGQFSPQHKPTPPELKHSEAWKTICPPRNLKPTKQSRGVINGLNKAGHFISTDENSLNAKTITSLKFENIACAQDYAIGVVNQLGQSKLFLIKLDDLSIQPYPFDLDLYLTSDRLSLNNKNQLAIPLRKGLFILSASAPPVRIPIKAWTATPAPDDSAWLVSTIDGMTLLVNTQGEITPIYGPKGVNQTDWPHPRIITWSGWSAGLMIATPDGNFNSTKTQIVYYRPRLKRFEYAKGSQKLGLSKDLKQKDKRIKKLHNLFK